MRLRISVLLSLVLLTAGAGLAHGRAMPIYTKSAVLTGFQEKGVRGMVQVVRKAQLLRQGRKIPDPQQREVTAIMAPLMVLPYGISEQLATMVMVPYVHMTTSSTAGGVRRSLTNSGFGDLSLLGAYAFWHEDMPGGTFRLAVLGGLKLPTAFSISNDTGGLLGSGSVDLPVSLALSWVGPGRFGLNADVGYQINTAGRGIKAGNALSYDLALGLRLWPGEYMDLSTSEVNLYLELNGQLQDRGSAGEVALADSGGHTLFLSPGLQWIVSSDFLVEAAVQIPAVQQLNGTQLGTDWTATLGLRHVFF